jgi:hypothetical protein
VLGLKSLRLSSLEHEGGKRDEGTHDEVNECVRIVSVSNNCSHVSHRRAPDGLFIGELKRSPSSSLPRPSFLPPPSLTSVHSQLFNVFSNSII